MLRNPLASPDVIGISSGASAAAVIGIVTLDLGDSQVSLLALGGALLTALGMYVLASRGGFAGGRLVLIGIGFAAVLQSVVAYVLSPRRGVGRAGRHPVAHRQPQRCDVGSHRAARDGLRRLRDDAARARS